MTAGVGSITYEYLTSFMYEQQRAERMRAIDRCARCRHDFHGLPCAGLVSGVHVASGCTCDSSFEAAT